MRYNDFKVVEATLKKATDIKYHGVVNDFIDQGQTFALGANGQDGVFTVDKGQKVASNTQVLHGTGNLNGDEIDTIKANQIFKSPQMINIAAGRDADAVTSTAQKETHVVKPSQIFKDEKFSATQVFSEVIDNPTLQQSEIGLAIIEMAKEIQNGDLPQFKGLSQEFKPAIRDYAGEYLGVLALIKGIANFPTRDAWFKHLGVSSLDGIQIYFPPESNNPLGDSEGYFENTETGNRILISSKGGKKGAPPSLNGLKIPDNLRTPEYETDIKIIEQLQASKAVDQPFLGINLLFDDKEKQNAIPEAVRTVGRLNEDDIATIKSLMDIKTYTKEDYKQLPDKFVTLLESYLNIERTSERASPGGMVHYVYNKAMVEAVNSNNALPNFEPMAREILQHNFIQIFARPKGAILGFDVLWPNKEMATGKIELYSKSSATEPGKAKLSFSVT